MNRARLVAAFSIGLLAASAQLPAASLPVDSQDVAVIRPKVDAFLKDQVAALTGTDYVAAGRAREAILAEVQSTIPTAAKPSGVFTDTYADALVSNLTPLLQNQDVRIRLNVAIIISRVAERAPSARFAPIILKLLSDQSTAVIQWGVHACQFVLPPLLNNPQQAQQFGLLKAMVTAVNAHNTDGSLVEAAYNALAMNDRGTNPVSPAAWNNAIPQVVDAMQQILAKRIDLYQKNIAPMPTIEQLAVVFLVSNPVWHASGPNQAAQQRRTMDLLCQLINNAAQRGPAAGINDRNDLVDLMRKSASGIQVVGGYLNDNNLITAGKQLSTVNAGSPNNYQTLADATVAAVAKIPQFAGINVAPPLPTSVPTTSEITTTP